MIKKKLLPICIAGVLIGISLFAGCVRPGVIDTGGWDHINDEGTAVRIWGQLSVFQSSDNWNEGFVWDTQAHADWQDYLYRVWADNHYGLGLFSLNIQNLSRTTTYHYRAFGEYLKGQNQYGVGVDLTFVPGGPRVATDNASNIGLTSVTLYGNLWHMGGAPECTVYFLWGTDQNALNKQTTPETMTNTGIFSATLSSLTTNVTVYFKAVAENDADAWAGIIRAVTPGKPITVTRQPAEIGNDHAVLKGELWNTGGTSDCQVWFAYSDASPNSLSQKTSPQTVNTTGPFQGTIENLSPVTKYWYKAVADNGYAQGSGDTYEFTTTPTGEIRTTGVLGKPYVSLEDQTAALLSKIPPRFRPLVEKHPTLLRLLLQSRFKALLT
jgi:hypothetical protein